MHSYREEAAKALVNLLGSPVSRRCVIALPPSGLMGGYLRAVKKAGGVSVALIDRPENIVRRLRFYNADSKPIDKVVTSEERPLYVREIRKDMTYFRKSYERADLRLDISGLGAGQAARRIRQALEGLRVSSESFAADQ